MLPWLVLDILCWGLVMFGALALLFFFLNGHEGLDVHLF